MSSTSVDIITTLGTNGQTLHSLELPYFSHFVMKDVRESGAWKTTLFFLPGKTSEEAITSAMHENREHDLTLSVHKIAHRIGVDVRIDAVRYGLPRSANVRDLEDAYNSPSLYKVTVSSDNVLWKGKVRRVEREFDT